MGVLHAFRARFRAVLGAVALALAASLLAPAGAAVRPPRLVAQTSTLPNGLRVVVLEDHSAPVVNVQVWYHVGSKDERPGRTGFAHLFEHLMFKGSKNVRAEEHTALVARAGGLANAYTTEDVTVYWNTLPSSHLPLVLWLEADRMATLRIDRQGFEREREVVKAERRMRIEDQPYGRLPEIIYAAAFKVHPYRHQVLGTVEDLERATVADAKDFFRTYYVPDNATVAIAGDVDTATAFDLARKYFGRLPRNGRPVPRAYPVEPPLAEPVRGAVLDLEWPLPVMVLAHHVPADGHPDAYPLQIASKILADGQSSRIHRKLVYEQGVALAAFGGGNMVEHPNLFFAVAIVQPGHGIEEAERSLAEELDRLRREPVGERELTRAKNQVARDVIVGRSTVEQKASALAHALVIHRDLASVEGEFDAFQRVTADDVQRVARTYFDPGRRITLAIVPKSLKGERP